MESDLTLITGVVRMEMIAGVEVGLNVARPLWIPRQRIKIKLLSQPGGADGDFVDFCVARFSRTDLSMFVARVLKIGKIADGSMPPTYETMHSVPVSMARGATWDTALEERVGEVIGRELRALGGNYFGGVCINLLRHR